MSALDDKNRKTLKLTLLIVAGMVALSFISVPLYKRLCQVTGWGGTTRVLPENPYAKETYDRKITVRFNSDIAADLPWSFSANKPEVTVKVGQDGFIQYTAENKSDSHTVGTAIYNVTPLEAGAYFYKTQCFCFGDMILEPKQKAQLPVVFFIDPKIMEDRNLRDIKTITLSYTFYKKDTPELEKAVENYMNKPDNRP